jgi:hypothetical protein
MTDIWMHFHCLKAAAGRNNFTDNDSSSVILEVKYNPRTDTRKLLIQLTMMLSMELCSDNSTASIVLRISLDNHESAVFPQNTCPALSAASQIVGKLEIVYLSTSRLLQQRVNLLLRSNDINSTLLLRCNQVFLSA